MARCKYLMQYQYFYGDVYCNTNFVMTMSNGFNNKIRMTIKESFPFEGVHHGLSRRGAHQGEGRRHHCTIAQGTSNDTKINTRHKTLNQKNHQVLDMLLFILPRDNGHIIADLIFTAFDK